MRVGTNGLICFLKNVIKKKTFLNLLLHMKITTFQPSYFRNMDKENFEQLSLNLFLTVHLSDLFSNFFLHLMSYFGNE